MRAGVGGVVDEVIEAIRDSVPEYAQPLEGNFARAVRTGVGEALTRFVDAVGGEPDPDPERWRRVYFDLGRGEARAGRTMESLLAAYRVGARVSWRRVADAAAGAGAGQADLTALAEAIFAYIDELSAISAEGYATEQAAAAGEAQRRRERLVRLATEGAAPAAIAAAAEAAGWALPSTAAALVARDDRAAALGARLGEGAVAAALSDGLACAIVPDADSPGRRREIRGAVGDRPAALGPDGELELLARSFERARAALELVERGVLTRVENPVDAGEHLPELLLHADPELLAEHAERELAPLAALPARSRERLLETLAAWIDHPGRPTEVARAIHVHPQTVRYRLRQLRDLVGEIDDPRRRFTLALALRDFEPSNRMRPKEGQ